MSVAVYLRIAEDLLRQGESGDLASRCQLPTELQLRERFLGSRDTVRDAVRRLATQRLAELRPGPGTLAVGQLGPFVGTRSPVGLGGETPAHESAVTARRKSASSTVPRVEVRQSHRNKFALNVGAVQRTPATSERSYA